MSTGTKVGIGILVVAIIIIGIATIMRSNSEEQAVPSSAEQPVATEASNAFPVAATSSESSVPVTSDDGMEISVNVDANTNVTIPVQPIIISYSGTGFSPQSLTVKVGTAVVFENESGASVWPASDPHPQHTGLLGFDGGQAVGPGGSYSYTFIKVGTWSYHNHLRASERGMVIVTQ